MTPDNDEINVGEEEIVLLSLADLVTDLEASKLKYEQTRASLSAQRGHVRDLISQLAERGVRIEVDGIYDEGESDGVAVPIGLVEPVVPAAGITVGPEVDGNQTAEEMEAAITNANVQKDNRSAAEIVTQAHAGVEEDPDKFATSLAASFTNAEEKGMADADKKRSVINPEVDQFAGFDIGHLLPPSP